MRSDVQEMELDENMPFSRLDIVVHCTTNGLQLSFYARREICKFYD